MPLLSGRSPRMPGTRIVLKAGEPDPDPAPFLFLSQEHKNRNLEKPYDPKRSCWVPDPDEKFVEGITQETTGNKVKVQLKKDKSVSWEEQTNKQTKIIIIIIRFLSVDSRRDF